MRLSVNWRKIAVMTIVLVITVVINSVLPLLIIIACIVTDRTWLLWWLLGLWAVVYLAWAYVQHRFQRSGIFRRMITFTSDGAPPSPDQGGSSSGAAQ